MNTQQIDRRTAILAVVSAGVGTVIVVMLFVFQDVPQPLWLFAIFAVAFAALEFSSVEVNDRLFVSSSIMVAFTAAVVFGRTSAVLAVALIAAAAVLHPEDIRAKRWRQPAYNLGQLVTSATLGGLVLFPFLPTDFLTIDDVPRLMAGAALAAAAYDWLNFRLVSLFVNAAYPGKELLPWSRMLINHAALALLGAYGALLGAAYVMVGPVALPLMFVTFGVGHIGFATYSRMRQAHEDTVSGFVKAIEALDPHTKGHSDRVAEFCRITGEQLGFDPEQLEVLRWAALIHDVGKLAAPADLINKEGPLSESEVLQLHRRMKVIEDLLSRVDFLAPAVAAVAAGRGSDVSGAIIGRVLRVADVFDAITTTRSYRSSLTQSMALQQLHLDVDLYGLDVVEALEDAIADSGVVYGAPDEDASAEVERLVQERVRRG